MPQNRATGAAANAWGRKTAQALIEALGGKSISSSSNEFTLDGERLVMKSAAPGTVRVGVSYEMLRRIDAVIAAFARSASILDLYRMTPNAYRTCMTPTRSRGASSGRVGIVKKKDFSELGRAMGIVNLRMSKQRPRSNNEL